MIHHLTNRRLCKAGNAETIERQTAGHVHATLNYASSDAVYLRTPSISSDHMLVYLT